MTQTFDLSRGALCRVGRNCLKHCNSLLQPHNYVAQTLRFFFNTRKRFDRLHVWVGEKLHKTAFTASSSD